MKVALITPIYAANTIKNIVDNNIDEVQLDLATYDNYTEAVKIVENIQRKYDAIMFFGIVIYEFVKTYVKEECIWGYFPLHESSLSFALLKAMSSNKNIKNISIDTYSRDIIEELYKSIDVDIEDVNIMLHEVDVCSKTIEEDAYNFHKHNLEKYEGLCIITALSDVNKLFDDEGINSYMAIPTKSIIIDSFQNLFLKYIAKINANSMVVAIFVEIDFPDDYAIISRNEYYYVREKNKVTESIYEFASKIEAAVIEFSYNTYIMISTKQILETQTENYTKIDLLKNIGENSLNNISMGIGYGKTASEAKYKANDALRKAKGYQNENVAYIIYEGGRIIGPVKAIVDGKKEIAVNDRLLKIAEITNVSIKKILSFYNAIDTCKKDRFTTSELSEQCNMSYRTVNRAINKLESYGYVEVVGKHFEDGSGRPRRIIKFKF